MRFGNVADVIFCRKMGWQILQDEINALYILWEEYDAECPDRAPAGDAYLQELNAKIDLLEVEQKVILEDIKAFEQELEFRS